ncbi:cyclic GMP-AMP synthase isoform X2 [Phalacrocorax carbo]|uniref:cyclic GMP-AMP synthase isoform X2 n=1 Tax=Phalacrocorax carbo TaxID=9209 RepID=UPI00311992E3
MALGRGSAGPGGGWRKRKRRARLPSPPPPPAREKQIRLRLRGGNGGAGAPPRPPVPRGAAPAGGSCCREPDPPLGELRAADEGRGTAVPARPPPTGRRRRPRAGNRCQGIGPRGGAARPAPRASPRLGCVGALAGVSFLQRRSAAWKRNLPNAEGRNAPSVGPRLPPCGCGAGAEAMEGAGGRGERGRRGPRPVAPRGRGAARGAARSPSRGRGGGAGAVATPRARRRGGSTVRRGRPSRRASPVRSPAAAAAGGGEAPPAPRSRAPAARARAAVADGAVAARPPAPPGALRLREVLSRLTLGRQDVSEASGLVNEVVSQLIQAIRSRDGSFSSIARLGAGSYYEHVKISEPNEFDIMLVIPVKRLQLDESDDTGAYYYLTFKRNPKEKYLLKYLDEDGKLSAFKMLQALREIIKQEVKNIKNVEVTVKRKKAGSPAITLQIKNPPAEISVDIILTLEVQHSWPASTEDGLKIEQWLGRKVKGEFRKKALYLVAKQNKKEKVLRGNTWRLSFSHVEKAMMNNHGSSKTCCESDGPKCCRKGCLKLMKYLLEQLKMKYTKELEKISSYHVKTAFFHSCVTWPKDTDWHLGDLDHCFQKYLGYFLDCLQKSHLPHFFIPQYNLLSLEDKASSDFLSREIQYQLNNRFPIFQGRY